MLMHSEKLGYMINLVFANFWLIRPHVIGGQSIGSLRFVTYDVHGDRKEDLQLAWFRTKNRVDRFDQLWAAAVALQNRILQALKTGDKDFDVDAEAKLLVGSLENITTGE